MQFPFVGPSYTARTRNLDAQSCINLYPEMAGPTSKSVAALLSTPGLRAWASFEGGAIRGVHAMSAQMAIVVAGARIYKVTTAGVSTYLGACDTGTKPVSIASNGSAICAIVTGPSGFLVNTLTNIVTPIVSDAFQGADVVVFLDGYFVFNRPGTGQFQISGLYDTTLDALDFATAEGSPDNVVSLIADHRELWLFGESTTEVFFNSGNVDFPFERINGAFIEQGCAATFSVAKMDNSVFWLTSDQRGNGMVMRAAGYQPQRVSTHALEYAIGQMGRIDDAVAYTYQQEGHAFYVLSFPSGNQTWVYDASTNMWHQRAWRNPADGSLNRHLSCFQMAFAGEVLVGDWRNGLVYALDLDALTDNGDQIARVRAAPHASNQDYRNMFFSAMQIDMEVGVGLNDPVQGQNPQAMLQWSDDGGYTWSNEFWVPMGRIGARRTRARWRRLGHSRDRVFRVTITDSVRVAIIGASVEYTVGRS